MVVVVLFVVGAVFGVIAGTLERDQAQRRIFLNAVIGIIGALFGGLFLARKLGGIMVATAEIEIQSLLWSCGGSVATLALFTLVLRAFAKGS